MGYQYAVLANRLSFSFAETKLMQFVSEEQKQAYKYFKILRESELIDYKFFNFDIEKLLRKKFASYHLKTVFLSTASGNHEKFSVREWLVKLLEALIIALEKKVLMHHFITDLNLLENAAILSHLISHGFHWQLKGKQFSNDMKRISSSVIFQYQN